MRTFRKLNEELCISVPGLATCQGISVESATNTIWKGLKDNRKHGRESYRNYPDPDDNRKKWVVLESLPPVVRERTEYYYGDLKTAWIKEHFLSQAEALIDSRDRQLLRSLRLDVATQDEIVRAAGWCRALIGWEWREAFLTMTEAFHFIAQIVVEQDLKGLKISNGRRLRAKLKSFNKDGVLALVSAKYGNSNAKKSADIKEWYRKRAVQLYGDPKKLTVHKVAEIINREAKASGWKTMSDESIRLILNKPDNRKIWLPTRDGRNAARQLTEAHVRRRRPARPDALWSVDGTTVQLYSTDGRKLLKEWYMVLVTDGCTDAIIGCGLGKTENNAVVLRALQSAAYRQRTLPDWIQHDHATANLSKETQALLDAMKVHKIPAEPYNGKSKYVERVIGRFEQNVLRSFPNFVGGNITAKSLQARANPDFLSMQLKGGKLPKKKQVEEQLKAAVEIYNLTADSKGNIPLIRYTLEGLGERRKADYLTLVDLFWSTRRKELRYNTEGLRMEVEKQRYFYEVESEKGVEDVEFRSRHLGDKFTVKWNANDLSAINLYQKGVWIATAVQKHEFAAIPSEREDWEGDALYKRLQDRKDYLSDGVGQGEEIGKEMVDAGYDEASFELIHKDAFNRLEDTEMKRILTANAVEIKPTKKAGKKKRLHADRSQVDRLLSDDNTQSQ